MGNSLTSTSLRGRPCKPVEAPRSAISESILEVSLVGTRGALARQLAKL
jgi:hypothetical protein